MKRTYLGLCLFFLLISCASDVKKQNTITISGAFALYPLVITWAEEYHALHPEVRFNITGGGAGKGMADAMGGAVDIGMFSRGISQEEKDKGTWWVGLAVDAVVPTLSARHYHLDQLKKRGLTREELRRLFMGGGKVNWGDIPGLPRGREVFVYTRSDACGAAETWAHYLGGKQENLLGIGIYGDPGVADAVMRDPAGIAFNNLIFTYDPETGRKRDGIEVLPIDFNGNGIIDHGEDFYHSLDEMFQAIAEGKYPSPPARELYFVSRGKPEKPAVTAFIRWTLTEGQHYVQQAGYVPLNRERINFYLQYLE